GLLQKSLRHPIDHLCVDERVSLFTMHDGVDAGDLVFIRNPESDRLLDRKADDEGDHERVHEHTQCGDELYDELTDISPDEQARLGGEQAEVKRAEQSTDEVDADDVKRIVKTKAELQLDSKCAHDTR